MLVTDEMVEKALDSVPRFELYPAQGDSALVVISPAVLLPLSQGDKGAWKDEVIEKHYFPTNEDARAFIKLRRMRAALEAVAPAIRAAALEEAAKVAEGWETSACGNDYMTNGCGFWDAGTPYDQSRADAAAAIRALKDKEPT